MASTATTVFDKSWFPLRSINDVVEFFRKHLANTSAEPDLTLLSIIAGYIEISLTTSAANENASTTTGGGGDDDHPTRKFPIVTFDIVDSLYRKFHTVLESVEKPKASASRQANRTVIKKISDIIYYSLFRSTFKDRAHLQSMYTYLSANKLDSFGVAFAVVAGCQFLGYKDVNLVISEDHAWVVFGKNRAESIEVTWHGKGNEDKRGQDVKAGIESSSWLYLAGLPVVCDRYMEVAAIVSAINISLSAASDCLEVADLQQKLLWMLYDLGYLQKYPMGLGNLGELEEVAPTKDRPTCEQIYKEAIKSGREHYRNHHIYPYTYLGGYYYRLNKYRETLAAWADAGDVLRLYTYNSRDDEEIYKEFSDIANEMIPSIMKTESSGHSARSILRDSECFANLVRFYDGICQWEEGSLTPILHIGWAKPLVSTISKYEYDIRAQVSINCADEDDGSTKKFETNEAKKETSQQQQLFEGNNNNTIIDGSYALTCGSDKKLKLWNPKSGLLLKTYGGHADEVTDASGSCDSCHIVSSSLDKSIIYWDVTTGQPLRRLRVHAGGVSCVRFNEDSSVAVSGSKDNTVMVWDIRTRKLEPIQMMKEAKDCITAIVVNDHKIITSSLDGCIRHYDIRAGEMMCDRLGEPITYIVQTKDEQCILAACLDGTVRLVDNQNGTLLSEYVGHKAEDYHIECGIMSNDSHIISGSSGGCAMVWDLLEGKVLQTVQISENSGVVHSLATHPSAHEILLARRRDLYVYGKYSDMDD